MSQHASPTFLIRYCHVTLYTHVTGSVRSASRRPATADSSRRPARPRDVHPEVSHAHVHPCEAVHTADPARCLPAHAGRRPMYRRYVITHPLLTFPFLPIPPFLPGPAWPLVP